MLYQKKPSGKAFIEALDGYLGVFRLFYKWSREWQIFHNKKILVSLILNLFWHIIHFWEMEQIKKCFFSMKKKKKKLSNTMLAMTEEFPFE